MGMNIITRQMNCDEIIHNCKNAKGYIDDFTLFLSKLEIPCDPDQVDLAAKNKGINVHGSAPYSYIMCDYCKNYFEEVVKLFYYDSSYYETMTYICESCGRRIMEEFGWK